ncbi:MAG TPA: hypothetical protein VIJ16_08845 [Gemmatimonadaceae bacterium]
MTGRIHALALALTLAVTAGIAGAQTVIPTALSSRPSAFTPTTPAPVTAQHSAVGPVLQASAVAIQPANTSVALDRAAAMAGSTNLTQSRAMMIVGGAGLIVGAIIGGTPGTLVMVGGGVVGLIGLYDYLQ